MADPKTTHVLEFIRDANAIWSLPPQLVEQMRAEFPGVTFSSPATREEAEATLPAVNVVLGGIVDAANFGTAKRLRWIHQTAAGVGHQLFPELVASDVVLTNGRGIHAVAMAEHTLGVMLMFARKLHLARDAQNRRAWTQESIWDEPPPIGTLDGTTMVLVGLGRVGSAIAERSRAFGVRVIALRRHPASDPAPADAQWEWSRLDEALPQADWVVLAPPLTPETRGLLDARRIGLLERGAVVINVGRGALLDEDALTTALDRGTIAGAALDVYRDEPLGASSPLWRLPNAILTPHVSGFGPRYWERSVELFRRNLRAWLDGRPLENVVDKAAGY